MVQLPKLPTNKGEAMYQVTLFDKPNYTERDIVARFLEQATFGGSREDINSFFTDDQDKNGQIAKKPLFLMPTWSLPNESKINKRRYPSCLIVKFTGDI
jgi:hypothetical protein